MDASSFDEIAFFQRKGAEIALVLAHNFIIVYAGQGLLRL